LIDGETIENIFLEFDEHKTKESQFAYQCDKLECDLQCKLYDEEHCVEIDVEKDKDNVHDNTVMKLFEQGKSWSEMWLIFGQMRHNYDKNFMAVSNYALNHKIS
jgi:5'-deoxynucleotidase YfbR-like HD superfamily hydrolase